LQCIFIAGQIFSYEKLVKNLKLTMKIRCNVTCSNCFISSFSCIKSSVFQMFRTLLGGTLVRAGIYCDGIYQNHWPQKK
jgi:hypothetical protein